MEYTDEVIREIMDNSNTYLSSYLRTREENWRFSYYGNLSREASSIYKAATQSGFDQYFDINNSNLLCPTIEKERVQYEFLEGITVSKSGIIHIDIPLVIPFLFINSPEELIRSVESFKSFIEIWSQERFGYVVDDSFRKKINDLIEKLLLADEIYKNLSKLRNDVVFTLKEGVRCNFFFSELNTSVTVLFGCEDLEEALYLVKDQLYLVPKDYEIGPNFFVDELKKIELVKMFSDVKVSLPSNTPDEEIDELVSNLTPLAYLNHHTLYKTKDHIFLKQDIYGHILYGKTAYELSSKY